MSYAGASVVLPNPSVPALLDKYSFANDEFLARTPDPLHAGLRRVVGWAARVVVVVMPDLSMVLSISKIMKLS